ncbi:MAG: signal peptidase I [Cellulomonadaceae bacterium]|nr:signal peptidase I [Cellulomonadaceae bacterium]
MVARVHKVGRAMLLGALALLAALMLTLTAGSRVAGWQVLDVQGGSMEPTIANGSALLTMPADTSDVHPGDVISLIGADGARVTHRVVDVDPTTGAITTRGDANQVNDAIPYAGKGVDRVRFAVPFLGPVVGLLELVAASTWVWTGVVALVLALAPWERVLPRRGQRPAPTSTEAAIWEHAQALLNGSTPAAADAATGGPRVTRRSIHQAAPAGVVAAGHVIAGPVPSDARGATVETGRTGTHHREPGAPAAGRRQAKAVGGADRVTPQVRT